MIKPAVNTIVHAAHAAAADDGLREASVVNIEMGGGRGQVANVSTLKWGRHLPTIFAFPDYLSHVWITYVRRCLQICAEDVPFFMAWKRTLECAHIHIPDTL